MRFETFDRFLLLPQMRNDSIQGLFAMPKEEFVGDFSHSNEIEGGEETRLRPKRNESKRLEGKRTYDEQFRLGELIDRFQAKSDVFPFAGDLNTRFGVFPRQEVVRRSVEDRIGRWRGGTTGIAN